MVTFDGMVNGIGDHQVDQAVVTTMIEPSLTRHCRLPSVEWFVEGRRKEWSVTIKFTYDSLGVQSVSDAMLEGV